MMSNKNATQKLSPAQKFIEDWKRSRINDENIFLKERETPEYKKRMKVLRGKTVKDGNVPTS